MVWLTGRVQICESLEPKVLIVGPKIRMKRQLDGTYLDEDGNRYRKHKVDIKKMQRKIMRNTRLLDITMFDNPEDVLKAGSTEEADMLAEFDRWELVDIIQMLDEKLFEAELMAEDMYNWTLLNYPEEIKEYHDDVNKLIKAGIIDEDS